MHNEIIRRALERIGILVALLTLATLPAFAQKTYTRLEIQDFSKDTRLVEAFRRGVEVMKQRKPTDPTSWIYQANIHDFQNLAVPGDACSQANQDAGVACGSTQSSCPNQPICGSYEGTQVVKVAPVPTAWATCPHGTWFFLPWHRMYLSNLEGILRKAACDSAPNPEEAQWCWDNFALPFWDYELQDNRDLPEIFRDPTIGNGKPNSLYVEQRAPGMNQGTTPLTPQDVSTTKAMSRIPYFLRVAKLSLLSFGSAFTTTPTHYGDGTGQLEQQPHNLVHNAVGEECGYMAYLQCAARDPIFFLHHANIDRLWQVWLNQAGNRANPVDQSAWTGWKFTFFDPTGKPVEMTACDILNTLQQLDYRYENVDPKVTPACVQGQPQLKEAAVEPQASPLLANENDVVLGSKPITVRVATAKQAGPKVLSAAKAAPGDKPLVLILDQVEQVNAGAYYRIYLNLPEGQEPDESSIHYIGTLALFGKHHHGKGGSFAYEIDDAVKALEQRGQWDGEIRLTFVRGNKPANAGAEGPTYIRIGRIEVSALR